MLKMSEYLVPVCIAECREMQLMKIPVSSELLTNQVRWPVFLLANKVKFWSKLLFSLLYKFDEKVLMCLVLFIVLNRS